LVREARFLQRDPTALARKDDPELGVADAPKCVNSICLLPTGSYLG
jgi:hypothetical protein